MLKEYKGQDKTNPVVLFDGDDATMSFNFYNKQGAIQTKDYYFEAVNKTDSSVTMRLAADNASYIDFIYTLKPNSYLMNFEIKATGMEGKLASTEYVDIDWTQRARQLEKGFTYENRLSELTYKVKGDNVDNLSAAKDDEKDLGNTAIDWVAFKNQFFSSVFIADQDFNKVSVKSRMEQQGSGYIKDYSAEMSTFFDPSGKQPTEMYFYFGPNHFKTLKALDKGRTEKWELNRLVYLGWPLIRWINQFITINVFDWLSGWGLSMGIVLLILTIMVKVVVYPATWKTYMSSAKMRVLKPKIDEINKKYPKQEDAMKKQQEVMGLYSQYGVSPMGGCLPMLLQFPILMALFMFVPSAIELRQQSFLWADDLSTYDAFITFPFHIPFLGNHLSLFCLLMTVTNILNILQQASPRMFLALGVAGLILLTGTDLSVGRMVGLGMVTATIIMHNGINTGAVFGHVFDFSAMAPTAKALLALLMCVIFTTVFSMIAGFFMARFKMHPFISTMANMLIIFGLVTYATKGVSFGAIDFAIPNTFIPQIGKFPTIILWAVAAVIIVWFIWNKTTFGKNLYAVGGNPEAAAVSGISVFKVTMGAFMLAGILYGFGSWLECNRMVGSGSAAYGQGWDMDAIAACVVGGVSFTGGIGKISGVVTGVLIFTSLTYSLTILGIDTNLQFIFEGIIILAAVTLDCLKYVQKK